MSSIQLFDNKFWINTTLPSLRTLRWWRVKVRKSRMKAPLTAMRQGTSLPSVALFHWSLLLRLAAHLCTAATLPFMWSAPVSNDLVLFYSHTQGIPLSFSLWDFNPKRHSREMMSTFASCLINIWHRCNTALSWYFALQCTTLTTFLVLSVNSDLFCIEMGTKSSPWHDHFKL